MPSVKSHFNFGLFCKNLTRFWPVWGVYLFIWALALPAQVAMGDTHYYAIGTLSGTGQLMAFFFAPTAAMAVFSYLYKGRAANLMHALPIRREGLFLTNFLSGLAFLLGPNLVVGALTFLAEGVTGGNPVTALFWIGVQSLFCIFFYCFAVFCAMFTGSLAALPIFYVILNFLFPALYAIVNQLLREFLYGFAGWSESWTEWFWPLMQLMNRVAYRGDGVLGLRGSEIAVLYACVGLVLAVAALLFYRRHQVERAGDVVSVYAVRPVFKYGVAFSSAVVLGALFYGWFRRSHSGWVLAVYMLLCGALGYFIAEMLLKKSFRVFRAWKGCAAFSLALLLVCAAVELDPIGFARRVPDNAASVIVSGIYSYPEDSARYPLIEFTDPALIDRVEAYHHAMTDRNSFGRYGAHLHYTLPNGDTVLRNYDASADLPDALNNPTTAAAQLEALLNTKEARLAAYAPIGDGVARPNSAYLTHQNGTSDTLSTREAGMLYDAVCRDLEAGRIGRRFLYKTEAYAETCYDVQLIFSYPSRNTALVGEENLRTAVKDDDERVWITLQTTATDTLQALRELGVDIPLVLDTSPAWR